MMKVRMMRMIIIKVVTSHAYIIFILHYLFPLIKSLGSMIFLLSKLIINSWWQCWRWWWWWKQIWQGWQKHEWWLWCIWWWQQWWWHVVLTTFWLDPSNLILRSNKPLDHWPFWQQAAKQPIVSPEVTYKGTKKQVSMFGGLWFFELMSLLHIYWIDLSCNNLINNILTQVCL